MHPPTLLVDILRIVANLALAALIFVPLERLFAARRQKLFRSAFWTDIGYVFVGGLLPKLLLQIPLMLLAFTVHRALPSAYYNACAHLPMAVRLLGALAVGDLGFYWAHRWMHEVPFLWRFHAVHHSAPEMDFLVNTRAHPFDIVFGRFCGMVPIYLLGLAQPMTNRADLVPLLFVVIGGLWGFFIHANINWRFGWLESVVSTPAFHHWHHTNDGPEFIDKNYAAMLPVFDRLFGTYYVPKTLPVVYGIKDEMPAGLVNQLLHPLSAPPRTVAPAGQEA
jgi:sterol desaturase/sphingolipid hydroxylase (fatty acid hydroxylase superfamily)